MFRSLAFPDVEPLHLSAQTPDALVSAGQARSAEEKLRDSQELESLRQKENAAKRSRTFQRGTRYNFYWKNTLRNTADIQSHGFNANLSHLGIPALEVRMLYKGSSPLEKMIRFITETLIM